MVISGKLFNILMILVFTNQFGMMTNSSSAIFFVPDVDSHHLILGGKLQTELDLLSTETER